MKYEDEEEEDEVITKKTIYVTVSFPIEFMPHIDELRGADMPRSAIIRKIVREYLRRLDRID